MTKAELVAAIAHKTGLKQAQAKDALDAMLGSVTESLKAGNEVRLVGFGSFTPVDRPAGMARNPRTGAAVKRPASKTARFRVGDSLKAALNEGPGFRGTGRAGRRGGRPFLLGGMYTIGRMVVGGEGIEPPTSW